MYSKLTTHDLAGQGTALTDTLDPRELFGGINTALPVIVAVSGGGDSMALLLLAAAWANSRNAMLQVVTVDHGLRPEAAAEAAFVAGVCERLDLSHVTLAWEGVKPTNGLPDASRRARYGLLEEFAADIGAGTIVSGHTADDQAETIAMRIKRDGGNFGRGLAGMARMTILPGGTKLVRPLINLRRHVLRQYLASCSQSWVEDPSNMDESYERVRTRQEIAADPLLHARLLRLGAVMARFRRYNASQAARLLHQKVTIKAGPVYEFNMVGVASYPQPIIAHALQVVVALAGGMEHLVPASRFEEVLAEINTAGRSESQGNRLRVTLGRTIIEGNGQRLLIYRETRNLSAMLVGPGDEGVWDGRFRIINHTSSSLFVGACEMRSLIIEEEQRGRKLPVKPRAALRSSLAVKLDGDEVYFPMAEKRSLPPRIYVRLMATALEYFCPEWDEPLIEWIRELELVGKDEFMGRSSN